MSSGQKRKRDLIASASTSRPAILGVGRPPAAAPRPGLPVAPLPPRASPEQLA